MDFEPILSILPARRRHEATRGDCLATQSPAFAGPGSEGADKRRVTITPPQLRRLIAWACYETGADGIILEEHGSLIVAKQGDDSVTLEPGNAIGEPPRRAARFTPGPPAVVAVSYQRAPWWAGVGCLTLARISARIIPRQPRNGSRQREAVAAIAIEPGPTALGRITSGASKGQRA